MKRYSSIIALLLCVWLPLAALAQSTTSGHTPSGYSATGDYALSGFDNVSYYNGNLNFRLPLYPVRGRGGAGYNITQGVEGRWSVEQVLNQFDQVEYRPKYNDWPTRKPGYSPGVMNVRKVVATGHECQGSFGSVLTLTRLSFVAANGAETEFVDTTSANGSLQYSGCGGPWEGYSRGTVFTSRDGSAMTFISDSAILDSPFASSATSTGTGWLIFRDGTRYRVQGGNVTKILDRNGNYVEFQYTNDKVTSITDSIKRLITVEYDVSDATYGTHDKITLHRATPSDNRIIRVSTALLSTVLHSGSAPIYYQTLFPALNGSAGLGVFDPTVVSKVWLPDGRNYQLRYNIFGELARVILPTGGATEYDWQAGVEGWSSNGEGGSYIYRRVTQRRTYVNGGTGTGWEQKQDISRPEHWNGSIQSYDGYVDVKVWGKDSQGADALLSRDKHYYERGATISFIAHPEYYSFWDDGLEKKTEYLSDNGNPGTVKRTVETDWAPRTAVTYNGSGWQIGPSNEPRVTEVRTILDDGKVSKVTHKDPSTGYVWVDEYNNVQKTWEYGFGSGSPGSLLRRTETVYLTSNPNQSNVNYATDTGIHIRNFPKEVSIYDAGGTERSRIWYEYDDYSTFSLQDRSGIVQHDSGYHTGYQTRGNLTKTIQFTSISPTPQNIYLHSRYDIAGNLVKLVDGRGKVTDFDFADNFGSPDGSLTHSAPSELSSGQYAFAFPTKTTNAVSHESFRQYNYYIGEVVDTEDANGVKTSRYYVDALDRMTKQISAVGLSAQMQTFYTYDDANRKLIVENDQTTGNDKNLKSVSKWDGLGRTVRSATSEGGGNWSIVDTEYDALGRAYRTSNPYRSTNYDTAITPSGTWTTTSFDLLGRVISAVTPDGATSNITYSGNATTVQDPAFKKKKTVSDGLGRITSTVLDPGGSTETTTTYLHNVFDKLVKSTQTEGSDTQNRYWLYDALGRLKATRYPEQSVPHSITDTVSGNNSWSNKITYDENGNITVMTDPRSVSTYFSFDDINRINGIGYSDDTTGTVYYYDRVGLAYGKGRLDYAERLSSVSGGFAYSKLVADTYDPFGRVKKQTTWLSNSSGVYQKSYPVEQTYNLAGQITQVKYPSGRTVNTTFDQAGRVATMSGNLGGWSANYITTITYNPSHLPLKESWGTNTALYLNRHYNNRLQNYDIRLGTSSTDEWSWNRGALRYYHASDYAWGDGGTNNNGNLWRADTFIPLNDGVTDWAMATQYYDYDAFNRLKHVEEFSETWIGSVYSNTQAFKQVYLYDNFGNRRIDTTNSVGPINKKAIDVNKTNNRVAVPSGQSGTITYDNAGNMIYDSYTTAGGSANRQFDGSNRLTRSYDGGQVDYVYDMSGKRFRKKKASGSDTWYIYGIGGELLAEYNHNASAGSPQEEYAYKDGQLLIYAQPSVEPKWVINDVLGTPRMYVDYWASLTGSAGVQRHDYLPFGEELLGGVGVRTGARGYFGVSVSGKGFTSQYHDDETNLDYFGARYYSSVIGRFISADPLDASGRLGNPQTWNRYSYVTNKPLTHVDPTGMYEQQAMHMGETAYLIDLKKKKKEKENKRKPAVVIFMGGFGSERSGAPHMAPFKEAVSLNRCAVVGCQSTEPKPNGTTDMGPAAVILSDNLIRKYGDAVDVYLVSPVLTSEQVAELVVALENRETVILYGYSAGGPEAMNTASALNTRNTTVDMVILVDPPLNILGDGVLNKPSNVRGASLITGSPGGISGIFSAHGRGEGANGWTVIRHSNADHLQIDDRSYGFVKSAIQRMIDLNKRER